VAAQAGSGPRRLTLTPVVLEAAAEILFLVAGSDKAARLAEVLGDGDGALPAQRIRPTDGALRWLVDAEAASALPDQAAPDSQRTTFEV
jgi:6-phosphogluconolactonase